MKGRRRYLYGSLGLLSLLGFVGVLTQERVFLLFFAFAVALERASLNMREEEKRKVRISAGGLQSVWRLRGFWGRERCFSRGWMDIGRC